MEADQATVVEPARDDRRHSITFGRCGDHFHPPVDHETAGAHVRLQHPLDHADGDAPARRRGA